MSGHYCDPMLAAFGDDEQEFLAHLTALDGVTVWVGKEGWPGGPEFRRPNGWQKLRHNGNEARLKAFEEYRDCLAMNTGLPLAVVDVDTRNNGDVEKVRALLTLLGVRIFAEVDTPGGGKHFYVEGHRDLPTVHSKAEDPKLPDYPGVDIQSFGCNVYLPGTARPKYDGRGYTVVSDELDDLPLLEEDDDGGAEALADWVAEQLARRVKQKARKAPGGAREWEWDTCEPWNGDPLDARQQAYLDKALTGEAEKVAGAKDHRNDTLFEAALKLGSYIAGAGLDEQKVVAALEQAALVVGLIEWTGERQVKASIRSGLRDGKKNPRAVPPPPAPGAVSADLEWFWELTPTLRHVRNWAHARLVGPWAVLGVCLARVVAKVPPTVQLPPWACGNASLNLFVALVGLSGDGKGGPEKTARDAFRLGPIYTTGIGSGQGINHLFAHYDGKKKITVMDRTSVYFSVPEVDTILGERGRTGSNLLPQLRKAWDGSDLTFGYADRTKAIVVDEHTYRLVAVVGVQPGRAHTLLGDVDAGTPQRYLWLPSAAPGTPMEDVAAPEQIDLRGITEGWPEPQMDLAERLIAADEGRAAERVRLFGFPDAAREEIRTNRKRKNRGESSDPALDGHLGLCRMKAAAALALLHGEREDTDGKFWDMSEALMAKSQATRASVEAHLAEKDRSVNRARGRAEGERAVVAEEVRDDAAIKRVAQGILRGLGVHGEGTCGEFRKRVAGRDRGYFEDALDRLEEAGSVKVIDTMIKLAAKC